MNELELIDWLRQQARPAEHVLTGPGDDCAVLRGSDRPWLATTDMLLDGCEFILAEAGAFRVGRKAMAVNLSDIAAMAGQPRSALVSVGLPQSCGEELPRELQRGLRALADMFATTIVGGDTNSWEGPLTISITLLGEITGTRAVLRSGAVVGDWLFVTGPLGGSITGKHLDFTPRVLEAQQLHREVDLHAMIDISDGLTLDAWRVCQESQCGACLFAGRIPITDIAQHMNDGRSALDHALSDGEDFELLFAVSPDDGQKLLQTQPVAGITLTHIGECVTEGLWLEETGPRRVLAPQGYLHDF